MSAKEITERQALLRRWSQLEPERCSVSSSGVFSIRLGDIARTERWLLTDGHNAVTEMAILLGALIEAITARGWGYTLNSALPEGHRAYVTFAGDQYRTSVAESPADSLLIVYIQALEAETK